MRQCSVETDIERGQGSFCFLFQYRGKTGTPRPRTMQSQLPLTLSYPQDQKWQSHHCDNTLISSIPDLGMAPMLSLEPLCSAAYFKRRASSSLIKNICSEWSSWNYSAWDFFSFSIGTSPVFHRTIYILSAMVKKVRVILLCVVSNIKIQT